ncbi:probable mitochondrial uncoupling protein 2 [Coccomyxa sp. Obi]|nr:probable mitochondrial uncoupling protein 2 [Coccomyxa sp. Obi]
MSEGLLKEFLTSGISVGCANFVTLPLDVLKVRLQTQGASFSSRAAAPGLLATTTSIVRQEGFLALYSGLIPALSRGLFYGGARLGTYGPIKTALGGNKDNNSLLRNILAGCMSGAFAAAVTNPIDLVKTRLQARDSPFRNAADVVRYVVKEQGVSGLWTGTTPSVIRAAALTATQCASYDLAKQWWMRQTGMSDNVATHLGASMLTGLATTTITAPVDLVKTNMFVGGRRYKSVLHCAMMIVKEDGPMGLLKGWTAQYIRLGPQTMVIFVVMEQLRRASGLESL